MKLMYGLEFGKWYWVSILKEVWFLRKQEVQNIVPFKINQAEIWHFFIIYIQDIYTFPSLCITPVLYFPARPQRLLKDWKGGEKSHLKHFAYRQEQ